METKKLYLLTLEQERESNPIGKILLPDNNIHVIIKGINKIETNNCDGEYYQSYAKNITVYGDPSNTYGGDYKDGVRWANMTWGIEEIEILS